MFGRYSKVLWTHFFFLIVGEGGGGVENKNGQVVPGLPLAARLRNGAGQRKRQLGTAAAPSLQATPGHRLSQPGVIQWRASASLRVLACVCVCNFRNKSYVQDPITFFPPLFFHLCECVCIFRIIIACFLFSYILFNIYSHRYNFSIDFVCAR